MFEELKERLEAAADAAHEEYCDAVKVGDRPLPVVAAWQNGCEKL